MIQDELSIFKLVCDLIMMLPHHTFTHRGNPADRNEIVRIILATKQYNSVVTKVYNIPQKRRGGLG